MTDPTDDDDIDRAYRSAVDATTHADAEQGRRAAVLAAIAARDATHETPVEPQRAAPGDRTAANDANPHSTASWWRGVAAACVIGASALVVVRMQQAPEATVETGLRSDAGRLAVPAPAPAGESTATQVAEAVPRQPAVPTAPAPATTPATTPAPVTDAPRPAPNAPATAPAAARFVTAAEPVAKAARSAFPGDGVATEASTGRIAPSGAAADAAARAPVQGLLVAVKQGDIEAVRIILQTTDPDAERDADGRTALAIAVLRAHVPLVELLLARGANRLAMDRFGHTPVSYAHASADTALMQAFAKP